MTAKIAARTEIAYTAQENDMPEFPSWTTSSLSTHFLILCLKICRMLCQQRLVSVFQNHFCILNIAHPTVPGQDLTLAQFLYWGTALVWNVYQSRQAMFENWEKWYRIISNIFPQSLIIMPIFHCAPSWPIMGNCIFPKAPSELSSQASPYWGGASVSLRLLYPPVNLPFLGCTQTF